MITNRTHKRIVSGVVGAAIAAPALLFIGTGTAGAVGEVDGRHATTTTTQRAPGHIAIHVAPAEVSAPRVWGAFDSPVYIVSD